MDKMIRRGRFDRINRMVRIGGVDGLPVPVSGQGIDRMNGMDKMGERGNAVHGVDPVR